MVSVKIGEKDFQLVFNWKGLCDLEAAIGMDKVANITACTPLEIAKAFLVAAKENHPELTLDDVLAFKAPFVRAIQGVDKALLFAYTGYDTLQKPSDGDKKK